MIGLLGPVPLLLCALASNETGGSARCDEPGGSARSFEPGDSAPSEEEPGVRPSRESRPTTSVVRDEAAEDAVEEIVITGAHTARAAPAETWSTVPEGRVRRSDARSIADVLRRAPGALVQTNSRGQTLVYLRNAGERQVSLFFDGAPLEIPWDHRIDLGLVPASAIGRTEVARGPLSNRYGPNISGGAVFLEPRSAPTYASATLTGEGGTGDQFRLESSVGFSPTDASSFLVAAEHTERTGEPLAGDLPFSQTDDELRTNTDARRTSALAHASLFVDAIELTLSLLYGSAAMGVAPEGHLDPALEPVRYWRYPDTELAMLIAGLASKGQGWAVDAIVWGQAFDQTIESFDSAGYERLEARQQDEDRSLGARARVAGAFGAHRLSVAAYGNLSSHHEARAEALGRGDPSSVDERFLHGLWSAGADYLLTSGKLRLRVGAGVDGLEPLDTAGRSSTRGIRGWNATAGTRVEITPRFALRAAAGSRARLPTPRELFGTALDRFVVNDDLGPERNTSLEVGMTYTDPSLRFELVPFATWTDDTLDQENVVVDGRTLRRRVNLDGSRSFGLEVVGELDLTSWLRCAGQLLLSDVRRLGGGERRLPERPALQGFAELILGGDAGPELATELIARSEAFSLAPEGLREVPGAALLNVRGAYRASSATWGEVEVYLRVDNLLDARLEPQLGLPEPGRWVRAGLAVRL